MLKAFDPTRTNLRRLSKAARVFGLLTSVSHFPGGCSVQTVEGEPPTTPAKHIVLGVVQAKLVCGDFLTQYVFWFVQRRSVSHWLISLCLADQVHHRKTRSVTLLQQNGTAILHLLARRSRCVATHLREGGRDMSGPVCTTRAVQVSKEHVPHVTRRVVRPWKKANEASWSARIVRKISRGVRIMDFRHKQLLFCARITQISPVVPAENLKRRFMLIIFGRV